jgi:alpha-glucosidase
LDNFTLKQMKKINYSILLTFISLFCGIAQNGSVGKIVSFEKNKNGITGKAENATFVITAYSENIVRIQISKNEKIDNFSYALVSNEKPNFSDFTITEVSNSIQLSTKSLDVAIEKTPYFKVTFKDKTGTILNEDVTGNGFGTTFIGNKTTVYKKLQEGERFVGMGESLGNLDRKGTVVTTWNTDNYKYDNDKIPMYISIPFYMGVLKDKVYGIFYDNSYRGSFNFGASNTRFSSVSFEGGDMDYFFIHDGNLGKILDHYSSLTGKMPLPPKWSIGYHQSRCSYFPESQVMFVAEAFRNKKIPLDCIVLDADYLQEYEPFRINTTRFPDMKGMANKLAAKGIELTASVNPGIKIDPTYEAYKDGLKQDIFLRFTDGEIYKTDIYPNMNHYPDFTNPKSRNWWIDKMKIYQDLGINGYWNDMNEPAIGGQAMPDNVLFDFEGRKATQLEAHNYYGHLMARSSFESFKKYGGNKRPFVMTRAAFAGIQRYAAVWSGDNQAKDEHILLGVLLNNQMGLSGLPFVGPDLGGFTGDGNKDLFKRWVEVGVFSPFLRNHREPFSAANEPWAYGEEAEAIAKTYIEFRYKMMPYMYSKFYEASKTGMPISRSLCIDNPFDAKVYETNYQHQFLFGDAFLIAPLTSKEISKTIYFPKSNWYNIYTDEVIPGNQELLQNFPMYNLPLYVKESSIIPLQTVTQSTKEKPEETLFVHVYNGTIENNFEYYEDDGSTLNYEKKEYHKRIIQLNPTNKTLIFKKSEGNFVSIFKKIKLIFHGFNETISPKINNKLIPIKVETIKLMDPLEYLEELYSFDSSIMPGLREKDKMQSQQTFEIENSTNEIKINW